MTIYTSSYTGAQIDEGVGKVLNKSLGYLFVSGNTIPTTVLATQTFYSVSAASDSPSGLNSDFTYLSGRLTYTGATPKWHRLQLNACIQTDNDDMEVRLRIGVNGTPLASTCAHVTISGNPNSGRKESLSTHTFVQLTAGDYIEAFVGDWTNTTDILVVNMQLSAEEVLR